MPPGKAPILQAGGLTLVIKTKLRPYGTKFEVPPSITFQIRVMRDSGENVVRNHLKLSPMVASCLLLMIEFSKSECMGLAGKGAA